MCFDAGTPFDSRFCNFFWQLSCGVLTIVEVPRQGNRMARFHSFLCYTGIGTVRLELTVRWRYSRWRQNAHIVRKHEVIVARTGPNDMASMDNLAQIATMPSNQRSRNRQILPPYPRENAALHHEIRT